MVHHPSVLLRKKLERLEPKQCGYTEITFHLRRNTFLNKWIKRTTTYSKG